MTTLTNQQKADIRFHYHSYHPQAIPLELERAINADYSAEEYNRITTSINRCNSAYNSTPLSAGSLITESITETDNDITVSSPQGTVTHYGDRTVTTKHRPTYQQRKSAYYSEVSNLFRTLGHEGF